MVPCARSYSSLPCHEQSNAARVGESRVLTAGKYYSSAEGDPR